MLAARAPAAARKPPTRQTKTPPPPLISAGEWEGVTAAFGPDGAPQPLPQHYVPDAYREWGVELFDWQSQCSATTGEGRELR